MVRSTLVFVAGGVTGALAYPYLQRAANNLLVSAIESIEANQRELEHAEKVKAEAEAERSQAESARAEVQQLRLEAERLRAEIERRRHPTEASTEL